MLGEDNSVMTSRQFRPHQTPTNSSSAEQRSQTGNQIMEAIVILQGQVRQLSDDIRDQRFEIEETHRQNDQMYDLLNRFTGRLDALLSVSTGDTATTNEESTMQRIPAVSVSNITVTDD